MILSPSASQLLPRLLPPLLRRDAAVLQLLQAGHHGALPHPPAWVLGPYRTLQMVSFPSAGQTSLSCQSAFHSPPPPHPHPQGSLEQPGPDEQGGGHVRLHYRDEAGGTEGRERLQAPPYAQALSQVTCAPFPQYVSCTLIHLWNSTFMLFPCPCLTLVPDWAQGGGI